MIKNRKQEILTAASSLMQRHGYSGFSYGDLSEALEMAKPSIHHHFPTKEDLGLALIDCFREKLEEGIRTLQAADCSPVDELRSFLAMADDEVGEDHRAMCPGGALFSNYANFPDSMQQATQALSTQVHLWIADVLRRGREAGQLRFGGQPEDEAWSVLSTLMGGRMHGRAMGDEVWNSVQKQLLSNLVVAP